MENNRKKEQKRARKEWKTIERKNRNEQEKFVKK